MRAEGGRMRISASVFRPRSSVLRYTFSYLMNLVKQGGMENCCES
jgi:hypothetical protein